MQRTLTLLKKNYLIHAHHRNKYLLIYLSPLLILILLNILQSWTDSNFTWQTSNPVQYSLSPIPKCYGEDCLTLGYIVSGTRQPYIDRVLDHVKQKNALTDNDVRQINITKEGIMEHLRQKPNKTQIVVIFCTDSQWNIFNYSVPCYANDYHLNFYTILYNVSLNHRSPYMGNLKQAYPKDLVTIKLKHDIDQAILSFHNPSSLVSTSLQDYPSRTSRFILGMSLFSNYGSFFLLIPYLILLVMQSSHLLHQKQKHLRIGLNIVGVGHFEYYLAEILTYGVSVAIISAMFCLCGLGLRVNYFVNSLVWFTFLTLFLNGLVLGLIAFNVMALVKSKGLGMSLIYAFILYSISMQWIFSGGLILEFLYLDSASTIVKCVKFFFNLYPSFHFSKIFTNIIRKADSHMDTYENRYVNGTQFTYDDLFVRAQQHYEKPFPHGYVMPSAIQSCGYLVLTSLIYIVGLWLFDNFIQSNRGYRQNLFKRSRQNRKQSTNLTSDQEYDQPIVKITNLQKKYDGKTFALRGISLSLKKGQIIGLLGQNGAGKSTLINILIGALSKCQGQILIDNRDHQTNITQIRKLIGVCPQFDILWQQLSAQQHIQMFFKLKGLNATHLQIKNSLDQVNLYENRNGKVSTFSGGMRRRLSLAISLIGQPKLVILDQPTTGMDAKIRLQTWKLILKIKVNRTVLITTHNMEEAQCLSDTIIIMSKGRLIVEGSSVELKKKYGQGYLIKGYQKDTKEEITIKCTQDQLGAMLEKINREGIQKWSISQTTLQQVFLNINQKF